MYDSYDSAISIINECLDLIRLIKDAHVSSSVIVCDTNDGLALSTPTEGYVVSHAAIKYRIAMNYDGKPVLSRPISSPSWYRWKDGFYLGNYQPSEQSDQVCKKLYHFLDLAVDQGSLKVDHFRLDPRNPKNRGLSESTILTTNNLYRLFKHSCLYMGVMPCLKRILGLMDAIAFKHGMTEDHVLQVAFTLQFAVKDCVKKLDGTISLIERKSVKYIQAWLDAWIDAIEDKKYV